MADVSTAVEPFEEATDAGDDDEDLFSPDDDPPAAPVDNSAVHLNPIANEQQQGGSDEAEGSRTNSLESTKIPLKNPDPIATLTETNNGQSMNNEGSNAEGLMSPPATGAVAGTAKPTSASGLSPSQFGLPEGVTIPSSVSGTLLQGRLLDTLRNLPTQLINDALAEYDDAVQIKGEAIRNHGAYLFGVIKRYVNVQERASRGEGQGILPMGPDLTPPVQLRLKSLVDQQFCTQEEMNDKVKSKIRMLSEKDALFAIDELASVERSQIRNFGSYFMGILNRYMRSETGTGSNNAPRGNKENSKNPQFHGRNQPQQGRQPQGRFDDRRGRGDERGPNSDRRGRDRQFRDQKESYRRERSRDQYDDDRRRDSFNGRNVSDRDRSRYDPRQQAPPSQHNPPYPGGPPQNQPFMGRLPQGGMHGGMHGNPPPPPPRSGMGQGGMPGMNPYGPQPPPHQPPPHQPPPQLMQAPAQPQVVYGGAQMAGLDQTQFVPHMRGNPQSASAMGQLPSGGHRFSQPVSVMGGQHQQPYMPQIVMNNSTAPVVMEHQQHSRHRQQPHLSHSYSHGMQHQNHSVPPAAAGPPNPMVGPPQEAMPGSYAAPGPPPGPGGWHQQHQQQGQVPVDIMGLADKAASVVQALANQNKLQMPPDPGPMRPPPVHGSYQSQATGPPAASPYDAPRPPPAPIQHPHGYGASQRPQHALPDAQQGVGGSSSSARRRTTAAMNELPLMVQYAVRNLQATGQIDGPLDDGMLGMVKDLPEELALQALQKFSTIDKNTMRNKTAYLAGVLRRELEKINRR